THVSCRCNQFDAGLTQRIDIFLRRQAEVKAHDSRLLVDEHVEHGLIDDEARVDLAQLRGRRRAVLREYGREPFGPRLLDGSVGAGGRMTEHVDVERLAGELARLADDLARAL